MEIDRHPAVPELCQHPAQARRRARIDLALGRDPFVAARPARIRFAPGRKENDLRGRRRLGSRRRRLGGIGFSRNGRRAPDRADSHHKSDCKQAGKRHGDLAWRRAEATHNTTAEPSHAPSVAPFAMYYNFVRVHKTLRTTPAMAAKVTKRLWEIGDIVDVLEAWENTN